MRSTIASNGQITTAVPIVLPAKHWVSPLQQHGFDPWAITVPILFLGGETDTYIAGPGTLRGYYDEVPGVAALGVRRTADHNAIQGDGAKFAGDPVAWLRYQLLGDSVAASAFIGASPEIDRNEQWMAQGHKNLPTPAVARRAACCSPTSSHPPAGPRTKPSPSPR